MAQYVLSFRQTSRETSPETEQAWGEWFGRLGEQVAEFGHRVGQARMIGEGPSMPDELSGYIVVDAESMDAAARIAEGCPGLRHGGRVEVGAVIADQQ